MNVSLPKITIPDLTPKEKQGLQDYWSVYEIHREEINAQLAEMAIHHPEFKIILQDTAAQLTAEEQVRNREIQKNAIYQDDWEPYLKNLQRQGMGYAQAGLSFHAWFEIVDAFRKYMTPYLLHAFGEEPERLLSTINGMDNLLDTTMSVIGEAYLEMKQQLIRQQEETVRDAERQKQSEKRFRGLLEAAPDAMVIIDQEGMVVMVNAQTEKVFGCQRDDLLGKHVEQLVPMRFRDVHPFHRNQYGKNPRVRPMGADLELYALRQDGTEFPVEISLSPMETEEDNLIIAAIRDITARKRAEARFRGLLESAPDAAVVVDQQGVIQLVNSQTEKLFGYDRLEIVGQSVEALVPKRFRKKHVRHREGYSVSHDLRAPLRSIDGFSHVLLEDYGDQLPEEGRNYLERVRAAAQRMAILIDDLLNLSRLTRTALQPKFINLSKMTEEITNGLRESQRERQASFSITPDLMVEADPHLMHIVLENLLSNAWKFTSKREQTVIEFGQKAYVKERTFYVRDNGVGFNMDYADKLFGVFQRLHSVSEFPGTGVGLATVQRIISIHGGHIRAESAEGKGTTFYFTL